jgi:hypothetical protein
MQLHEITCASNGTRAAVAVCMQRSIASIIISSTLVAGIATIVSACAITSRAGMNVSGLAWPPAAAEVASGPQFNANVHVEVSFFGVRLEPTSNVVFVLDRSGSMSGVATGFSGQQVGMSKNESTVVGLAGWLANSAAGGPLPSKLEATKAELIRTLGVLRNGSQVGIVFFDDQIKAYAPGMIYLDDQTRGHMIAFVRGIDTGGSTAAVPAVRTALSMGSSRLILLSDGIANTGGDGNDLTAVARDAGARGVRIDTIGAGIDQDDNVLASMASTTGGVHLRR